MIEYCALAFALLYTYNFIKWLQENHRINFISTLIFGGVGYLCKSTTMIPSVLFLAVIIIARYRNEISSLQNIKKFVVNNKLLVIKLFMVCVIPFTIGLVWVHYSDYEKAKNFYTSFLTSNALKVWNYGTLSQKLDIVQWNTIFVRIVQGFYPGILIIFLLAFLRTAKAAKETVVFCLANLVAIIGTILLIFNLYYAHDYYLAALSPFICVLGGLAFEKILYKVKILTAFLIVLSLILFSPNNTLNYLYFLRDVNTVTAYKNKTSIGEELKRLTDANQNIIIADNDWSPDILYMAERQGFMLRPSMEVDEQLIKTLKADNCNVFLSKKGSSAYPSIASEWQYVYKRYNSMENQQEWQIVELFDSEDIINTRFNKGSRYLVSKEEKKEEIKLENGRIEEGYFLNDAVTASVMKIECSNAVDDDIIQLKYLYQGKQRSIELQCTEKQCTYFVEMGPEVSVEIQDFYLQHRNGLNIDAVEIYAK